MTKFQEFLKAKNITDEAFKAKSIDEIAGLYNEYNEGQRSELEKLIQGKANIDDITKLKSEMLDMQREQFNSLNEILKEQGLALKRISDGNQPPKATSREAYMANLAKAQAHMKAMRTEGRRDDFVMQVDVKAVGDMSITGNVTGNIPQPYREPGMNRIQDRPTFVRNWITNATVNSNVISWVEQANRDGAAGGTAEGDTKNQIDFDLVEATETVKKRTALINVTEEMLADIDFMQSEINTELMTLLALDVDNQLLQGDGTGTNLNGIITQATTFDAGDFADTIEDANNYDVLRVAINQIMLADFMQTVIFMNPTDATAMQLTKNADGDYITFPFVSADGTRVLNTPIVLNTGVPADTFVVMDGTRAGLFERTAMTLRMGYSGDDFAKNRLTIIAEWRGAIRIKGNDIPAFITGEFSTAKAALEKP